MARFLNYFPQYTLDDLRRGGRLTYGQFIFLLGGMFDVEEPTRTESAEDRVNRKMRELAEKSRGKGGVQRRFNNR